MSRFIAITKDLQIPINLGLLLLMIGGVFALAMRVAAWERKLDEAVTNRWTYSMEKEAWHELGRANPDLKIPNITAIKSDNSNNQN